MNDHLKIKFRNEIYATKEILCKRFKLKYIVVRVIKNKYNCSLQNAVEIALRLQKGKDADILFDFKGMDYYLYKFKPCKISG